MRVQHATTQGFGHAALVIRFSFTNTIVFGGFFQ